MKNSFKPLLPWDCNLQDTRIDIWQYPLDTEFIIAKSLLDTNELLRAERYYFPRHQRRFSVARAMLRLILARYLQVDPRAIVFNYNAYNKPEISHESLLQFNLSHCGDLALLAIGKKYAMGIDVEGFSARPYDGIGRMFFSSYEYQCLLDARLELKPALFFNIWTQKEAFIKACGRGLSYPSQQFELNIYPRPQQDLIDLYEGLHWQLVSFMPKIAFYGALCHQPQISELRYLRLDNLDDFI